MPSRSRRFRGYSLTWQRAAAAALAVLVLLAPCGRTYGEDRPSGAVQNEPERRASPPRGSIARGAGAAGRSEGTAGWWVGTGAVALALAACGWLSLLARRYRPGVAVGSQAMRVVGRTSLSPKHSVYLLEVDGRVLIVGAGSQGAPSLLGELGVPAASSMMPGRFDHRLGDEA